MNRIIHRRLIWKKNLSLIFIENFNRYLLYKKESLLGRHNIEENISKINRHKDDL